MRTGPSEGWILAGVLDGTEPYPRLTDNVAGLPYVLRLALDMAVAGVKRIAVIWQGGEPPEDVEAIEKILDDQRLASRAAASFCTGMPPGDEHDAVLVTRADRIYHRDIPKQVVAAWKSSDAALAKVDGAAHDAVVVTDRATARKLAHAAQTPDGIHAVVETLPAATADVPYLGFTTPARERRALRRAERRLVWSLRKSADGIAAKALNRHISLPLTWLLMRTPVHPNHSTVVAFLCAVAGAIVIGQGGWAAGAAGMALVELGSIVDGIDGELARLKYQFSRLGQWMDTVSDDLANICYVTGIAFSLREAGMTWAFPVAVIALVCFVITQTAQYLLISLVYKSGDLAAIPWAFQSSDFLSSKPTGFVARVKATVPKMLKRDFAVSMFFVFALIGHLEFILAVFSAGAISFFVVFWIQLVRNRQSLRTARAA
jgi:phosphatidylglycerophosphate synthase